MKITYDHVIDALYVQVTAEAIKRTVEVRPNVLVDLNARNEVVGYEVLNSKIGNTQHFWELVLPTQQEVVTAAD